VLWCRGIKDSIANGDIDLLFFNASDAILNVIKAAYLG
jgi:hypothetical protein